MFYLLKNRKRAKELLREEEKRIELERLNHEMELVMKEEISGFIASDKEYLQSLTDVDIYSKDLNPATFKKEMARVKLALYVKAPNFYMKSFGEKPFAMLDTIYVMNAEFSHYPKSISRVEEVLEESLKKEDFPPKQINLDTFDEASYYALCTSLMEDLNNLTKFLNEMQHLSKI